MDTIGIIGIIMKSSGAAFEQMDSFMLIDKSLWSGFMTKYYCYYYALSLS